ncbi:MAG: 2,3,4,5-tetrahydropyridine-2,6-dicarboxylate N-succinyltransferase [Hyphomicrobiales bacterium]|nr:2,3,4,5-tetrahydropyridine-2,6-dicarboxylate N-succinyltransferase [Hyphomicrobiales bacterium]
MSILELQREVEALWLSRASLGTDSLESKQVIDQTFELLDRGEVRVAEFRDGKWQTNQWLKKAVVLFSPMSECRKISGGPNNVLNWYDRGRHKFDGWSEEQFRKARIKVVPPAVVRYSAYLAPGALVMPSFIGYGAYIDSDTLIDSNVSVASCVQVGKNCHVSINAALGGVTEPLQADPVIIEDDCFIGACSTIAEGVRVGRGSVLSMGVFIGASTPIVDRHTGEIAFGVVPEGSVIVPGSLPGKPLPDGRSGPSLYCAVIAKRVDASTRAKIAINTLLREAVLN